MIYCSITAPDTITISHLDDKQDIHNINDFNEWATSLVGDDGSIELMCSSSIDFPCDYDANDSIVDLCNLIRGNRVPYCKDEDGD